jgi:hypothetical protein
MLPSAKACASIGDSSSILQASHPQPANLFDGGLMQFFVFI